MNTKRKTTAIDREHNKWKQNQSSGGASVDQEVPECPTYDGYCGTLLSTPPHGSASPLNGRTASGQSLFVPPTSTRSFHPIMDPHDIRHCRLAQLALIQAEAMKLARHAEARGNLIRQTAFRRLLGKEQALRAGQQRLDEIVHTREQFAAELAARLRLAAPGKQPEARNVPAIAINATRDVRSVAAGETVEPLDALTSVAETMAQSDRPCKRADELCDRDTRAASPAARSGSCTITIGSQPEHAGVLPAPPLTGWGVHTLQVTTTDTATETSFDRRASSAKAHDLRTQCVASASRHASRGMVGKRYSSDSMGDGPSARTRRTLARRHQQDHMMVRDEKGNILTEDEQVAYVLSLSDTGSGPSSAAAPAPTPSPVPTPPVPQISLLVTLSTHSGSRTLASPALLPTEVVLVDGDPDQPGVASIPSARPVDGTVPERTTGDAVVREATAPVTQSPSRTADSPDVEIVPAPPRPPIELIVITDDHPDADATDGDQGCNVVVTCDYEAYASDESSDVEPVGDAVPANRPSAPTKPRPKRKKWHDLADSQYAEENWHIAVNRQFNEETNPKRRRIGDANANSGGSTRTPMTQSARAPTAAVLGPPQARDGKSIVVCGSESTDQLCSIPGCSRPHRMWRVDGSTRQNGSAAQRARYRRLTPPLQVANTRRRVTLARWPEARSSLCPRRRPRHRRRLQ